MSFKSYDIAERLQRLGSYSLFFTMNPNQSAELVPEDEEGGNPYSYYNIPYSIVPQDGVFSTDPNAYGDLTLPLQTQIPCSVWDANFPPAIENGELSLCDQFTQLFNDDCNKCFTDGVNIIQETSYCYSPLASIPPSSVSLDFGSQSPISPVRFSRGIWRPLSPTATPTATPTPTPTVFATPTPTPTSTEVEGGNNQPQQFPCEVGEFPEWACIEKYYMDTNATFDEAGTPCPVVCRDETLNDCVCEGQPPPPWMG
jgi:hypothetical protein